MKNKIETKEAKKMEKTKILYIVIAVLVIIILALLANSWYTKQIIVAQNQGYNLGYSTAVIEAIQKSRNCQPFSLFVGNQTFNFIDVACLKTNEQLNETK